MKVHVIRTAMCGGGLSYDVYVPIGEVPRHVLEACPGGTYYTRINNGGREFMHYEDATLSVEHVAMEQGIVRYEDRKAHDIKARGDMLLIAALAYPDLDKILARTNTLPRLWVNGLMEDETSAEVVLDIAVPEPLVA